MTRYLRPLSLKPVWNCVTMRLQNPPRQFGDGCAVRASELVELFIIGEPGFAVCARSFLVSSRTDSLYLFSATYAEIYSTPSDGQKGRESEIFQHRLLARG